MTTDNPCHYHSVKQLISTDLAVLFDPAAPFRHVSFADDVKRFRDVLGFKDPTNVDFWMGIEMSNTRRTLPVEQDGLARNMPLATACTAGPEGALIPDEADTEDGKIAVIYDIGDTPPEITIAETNGSVQTILANGIAVAIVACADGPRLTVDDILLVQRYRPRHRPNA